MVKGAGLMVWLAVVVSVPMQAQTLRDRYRSFEKSAKQTYADWRNEANARYAKFLAEAWTYFEPGAAVRAPRVEWDPLMLYEDDHSAPMLLQGEVVRNTSTATNRHEVYVEENNEPSSTVELMFYGTPVSVRMPKLATIHLQKVNERHVSKAWQTLAGESFDNLLHDCLAVREHLQLCDYAYAQLLKKISAAVYGDTPEAVVLQAFLYAQSGYAMRLGCTQDGRLYMLMGSKYLIFNQQAFRFGDLFFYPMEELEGGLMICNKPFSNEQPMTLLIRNNQQWAVDSVQTVSRRSKMGIETTVHINRNDLDFYNVYPTGNVDGDPGTRLAIYANAPLEPAVKDELYPVLEAAIRNNTEREAVNKLLNYVQTAFTYELDDNVWGEDRAFFPLESLFYPYNDCEDRSVLLARLVRDLLHLDVVLLHYPGHLATAVAFNEEVKGDAIMVGEKKYVVCDPTYIGASVGKSMPQYKNTVAKIIEL